MKEVKSTISDSKRNMQATGKASIALFTPTRLLLTSISPSGIQVLIIIIYK
jgi:hypothetical protein